MKVGAVAGAEKNSFGSATLIVRVMVEIIVMDGMATLVAMITEMTIWTV